MSRLTEKLIEAQKNAISIKPKIGGFPVLAEGRSTFPEFLQSAWKAGVIGYDADFIERSVSYFGVDGENYREEYLEVDINRSNK